MSGTQPRPGADDPRRDATAGAAGRPAPAGDGRSPVEAPAARPDARPDARTAGPAAARTAGPQPTGRQVPAGAGDRAPGTARGKAKGRPAAQKPASDWGTFRAVVIAVGVILVAVGAYFLIAGTHGLPDSATGPFNPTLESQFRFFAAQQIGVGAAFIAIAVKFQWVTVLWLVCMMVFFGGVGRVLSWAIVGGTPHWLMIVLMIVELAFPAALLVWHRWITKTVALKRSLAADR